ncbi:hypothetical protein PIIN_06480 [Serendipita indica DSM 11827]|uniref:WIBG Mago-binding domain-containing protein n=1 Tax=Serendipita indica (strain DSM 11827) TaxID=1109443 RepID=G4TMK0_SERID|nr:hypothetical protein PIIN_06480 [Serendipita indica DSM 11827]
MPLPDVFPETTASGIAVDPKTLDRVVPATRRADGSLRKEIKIRPGFTPQEDQSRFRGSRQQQAEKNALPKGHILGWVAPSSGASTSSGKDTSAMSKSAKKNARRAEKKKEDKQKELEAKIREAWDEDSDDDVPKAATKPKASQEQAAGDDAGASLAEEIEGLKV